MVIAYAIIVGFLAKELVVSAVVTATGALSPQEAFRLIGLTTPSAIALALFVALYIPCAPTIATIYSETRNIRYVLVSIALMLITAYLLAIFAYSVAVLLV